MAIYFENYVLNFQVTDNYMLGRVVGESGENQREIEKMFRVKMIVQDKCITLKGSRVNVFAAENYMVKCLEKKTFKAVLDSSYFGYIVGKGGQRISNMRNVSKAHIHLTKMDNGNAYMLDVAGRSDQVTTAMKMIFDAIYVKLKDEFEKQELDSMFQHKEISMGKHEVTLVKDQISCSPSLFFLNFINNEEIIKVFEPVYVANEIRPPKTVFVGSAILAPYGDVLYRAIPIAIRRTNDGKLMLKVKFIDYGNISLVEFIKCQECPQKYFYSPRATQVRLWNIRLDHWTVENLDLFRQLVFNNGDKIFEATVMQRNSEADGILTVKLLIPGIGDVANYLVGMSAAAWIDDPFLPLYLQRQPVSAVGSTEMLYVCNGVGSCVKIDVAAVRGRKGDDYTIASNFDTQLVKDSIRASYVACKNILLSMDCRFLDENGLHFSVENQNDSDNLYYGTSAGLAFAACILSESLGLKISAYMAFTGEVNGHGCVSSVGHIREKLRAAKDCHKKIVFVPKDNAGETWGDNFGMDIRTCSHIQELITVLKEYDNILT